MMIMGDKKRTVMQILGPVEKPAPVDAEAALRACAEELITAVNSHDVEGVMSAFRAMFQELERQPHEEASHTR